MASVENKVGLLPSRCKSNLRGERTPGLPGKCVGVDLTLLLQPETAIASEYSYFGGLTSLETRLLQKCLGEADLFPESFSGSSTVEGEAYTWDYGDVFNPHLVRLVDRTDPFEIITDMCNRTTDEYLNSTGWVDASIAAFDGGRDSNAAVPALPASVLQVSWQWFTTIPRWIGSS